MFLSMFNASLALRILAASSTLISVPPCLSITLPGYANESASSNRSPCFHCDWIFFDGVDPNNILFTPIDLQPCSF